MRFLERAVRRARAEPWTAALFAVAALATLAPIWAVRRLPLLDWPNALSSVHVLLHLDDPSWNYARFYERHLAPVPYWAMVGPVWLLARLVGVELAGKLWLSAVALALPVGVGVLARRLGRDWRLALFAFPLVWNYDLAEGFASYFAGIVALLYALALVDRAAEAPSPWRLVAASLAGASLYFFHILPWAVFLALGATLAACAPARRDLRARALALVPLVPALAVGAWAYAASRTMQLKVNPYAARGLASVEALWWPWREMLARLDEWLLDVYPGRRDTAFLVALALALVGFLVARAPAAAKRRFTLREWRLEATLVVAVALLFALPRTLRRPFYWYAISQREAIVVALLAPLAVRGPLLGTRLRRALFAVVAAVAVLYPLDVALHFRRVEARTAGFDEVIASVPRGASVLPLMVTQGAPDVNVNCFNQWGSYVQMHNGGYVPYNNDIDFPIHHKVELPSPRRDHADAFDFWKYGYSWDWFLVYSTRRIDLFADAHDAVDLVASAGDWRLYRKRGAKK